MRTRKEAVGWVVLFASLLFAACAPTTTSSRGLVVMKINETVAHVRTRDFELSVGDRVRLVRRECRVAGKTENCTDREVGTGIVRELLNPHDAAIELAPGATFVEGDEVEKLQPNVDGGPQAP